MADIQNSGKKGIGNWYWSMTKNQKILIYVAAVILLFIPYMGFFGFIALIILLYCQLGKERYVHRIDLNKNNHLE